MNFAVTISRGVTGSVKSVSKLPILFSSAKSLIVMAGTKKESSTGNKEKKPRNSALFNRKKVEKNNSPENTKNKQPTI